MIDLSFDKILVILVVAVFLIGPTRLPAYAASLARIVRRLRSTLENAKDRAKEELGDDLNEIDWQALDPRRYDPRRIVRDALFDGEDPEEILQPRDRNESQP
jgi:sec-independent protein translocase protein TatB